MMLPRNAASHTSLLLAIVAIALVALPAVPQAHAQPAPRAADASVEARLQAPLPDKSHLRAAHQLASEWVASGEVTETATRLRITGVFGAAVTLRHSGLLVGFGEAFLDEADPQKLRFRPVDVVALLETATFRALKDAEAKIRNEDVRNTIEGKREVVDMTDMAEVGKRLMVGVQIAYNLETIELPRGATPTRLLGSYAPGYHGLVIRPRTAADKPGILWPAVAVASNLSPVSQVAITARKAGYPREHAMRAAQPEGPILQRFDTLHAVRASEQIPARILLRGNVYIPPEAITDETLEDMGRRMTRQLLGRITSDDRVRGPYLPTPDRYEPQLSRQEEVALAVYALVRRAGWLKQSDQLAAQATHIQNRAIAVAKDLADEWQKGKLEFQPAAGALLLLALAEAAAPGTRELRDDLGSDLLSLRSDKTRVFRSALKAEAPPANQATQSLIFCALSAWYQRTRDEDLEPILVELIHTLWQGEGNAARPNIAALPWYIYGFERITPLLADRIDPDWRGQRLDAIRKTLDHLSKQQIIEPPILGPMDVFGGFELRTGPPGSPPNPTWQSAQCVLIYANALRLRSLRSETKSVGWFLTANLGTRFIAQLMFDRPATFYLRNPSETIGGVRLSLWDNRLPVSPTAVSLIAVTSLQEANALYEKELDELIKAGRDKQDNLAGDGD